MTSSPHAASDKVDLDELLRDVKPYSGGDELAIPGFYRPPGPAARQYVETDQEHAEFVAWYRAGRER